MTTGKLIIFLSLAGCCAAALTLLNSCKNASDNTTVAVKEDTSLSCMAVPSRYGSAVDTNGIKAAANPTTNGMVLIPGAA